MMRKYCSHRQSIMVLLLLVGLLLASPGVQAQSPEMGATTRMIIAFRPGASPAALQQASTASTTDIRPVRQFERLPGLVAEVTPAGLAALEQNPIVAAIAPDMPVAIATVPLQPVSENGVFIGANAVWQTFGLTGAGITAAVLDTGIDLNHPDFNGAVIAQQCFSQNNDCPPDTGQGDNPGGLAYSGSAQDDNGHGTHVAGILAGRGQIASPGIAPGANLVAVKVLGRNGSGFSSDVLAGIDWVVSHQAQFNIKLINLSLGGGSFSGSCDQTDATTMLYAAALQAATQSGITVFAASGNGGQAEQIMTPACISDAVSVGSVYHTSLSQLSWPGCVDVNILPDQVPCSSNSNPTLDLLAPGVFIPAARLGGGQISRSGTSMATPHATAAAALLLQAEPTLSSAEIRALLRESGVPVLDNRSQRLTARLNLPDAVAQVLGEKIVSISGSVKLQGQSNHSGANILLNEAACNPQSDGSPVTATAIDGSFSLSLSSSATVGCIRASKAGYLSAQVTIPLENNNIIVLPNITLPAGDVTQDNRIDVLDLAIIAGYFNTTTPAADVNGDGLVNILDLVVVAGNYGRQGPIAWTVN